MENKTITEIEISISLVGKSEYLEISGSSGFQTFFLKNFNTAQREGFTGTDAYKIKTGTEVIYDGIEYSISDVQIEYYSRNPIGVEPKQPVVFINIILCKK